MAEIGRYYNVADQNYGVNCFLRDTRYAVKTLGERYFMGQTYMAVAYLAIDSWGEWAVFQGYVLPEVLLPAEADLRQVTRSMLKKYDVDGVTAMKKPHRKSSKHKKRKRKGWG